METPQLGMFQLWTLVGNELHLIRLTVLCISMYFLYLNKKNAVWRKVNRILSRSHRVYNRYEYSVPEEVYQQNFNQLMADLSTSDNAGIYETQVWKIFTEQLGFNLISFCFLDATKFPCVGATWMPLCRCQ